MRVWVGLVASFVLGCGGSSGTGGSGSSGAGGSGGSVGIAGGGSGGTEAGAQDSSKADGQNCTPIYATPGCGDAAPEPNTYCSHGELCLAFYCSCEGKTIGGPCSGSSQPYAYKSECDAGSD